MTPEDFIRGLKVAGHDSGFQGIQETLERPPGQKPPSSDVELSEWYHSLPDSDTAKVMRVVRRTVHASIVGFLCVLDGVRAIEDKQPKGAPQLYYVCEGARTLLNDQREECLHDIYQGEVYAEVFLVERATWRDCL